MARQACQLLIEAKSRVRHGHWLAWLKENISVTPRMAQNYMRIAEGWQAIEVKCETVSHLTVRQALNVLAEPEAEEAPPAAPGPVVEQLLAGLKAAGLLPDPAVVVERVRAIYGALTVPASPQASIMRVRLPDAPQEPLTPSQAADGWLNWHRVEDMPAVYLARPPFLNAVPEPVLAAVEAFRDNAGQRQEVGAWEVAAVWWGCQAALSKWVRENLDGLMKGWRNRLLDAVFYFTCYSPEHNAGRAVPPPSVEDEERPYWYGHASDLRHAGLWGSLVAVDFEPPEDHPLYHLVWDCLQGQGEKDWLLCPSAINHRKTLEKMGREPKQVTLPTGAVVEDVAV
jgi:hypothetical protein